MKRSNDRIRELGQRKGDVWDRFERLQRNLSAFSRGKGKRRTVQRFRTYLDLADGRGNLAAAKGGPRQVVRGN